MSRQLDVETPDDDQDSMSTTRLVLIIAAATVAVVSVGLGFVLAPLEWPLGGIYVRIMVATLVVNVIGVLIWNPKLIGWRAFPGAGTKTWDWAVLLLLTPAMIGVFVVAGLDGRDWGSSTPGTAWLTGLGIHAVGWGLVVWSMAVNPFFEKTVRIQTDNQHRVIDAGPYAFVRHPGYVGFSLWLLSAPLLLASAYAFVPAMVAVAAFVIRTALEDRMLQAELPGYAAYATRTRFRQIPGVW